MIGILKNTSAGWFVQYSVMRDEITSGYDSLPLHPIDVKRIQKNSQHFDNTEARVAANPIVNFEIVKENVDTGALEAPYIEVKYAKLVPINEQTNGERFDEFMRTVEGYPELEGTVNLCEDIIEARAKQSVPAPGDSETELRRVRSAKNHHVKAQNWEIAALYREIEKLLETEERTCSNCQMLRSAIGVGQGLICDLNKCRIPHSKHSCQYHFKTVTKSAESASFDTPQTQTVGVKTD